MLFKLTKTKESELKIMLEKSKVYSYKGFYESKSLEIYKIRIFQ